MKSSEMTKCPVRMADRKCVLISLHEGPHSWEPVIDNRPTMSTKATLLTLPAAIRIVKKWECLPYFPKTTEGVTSLAEAFMKIVGTAEAADWMATQVIDGFSRCPVPIELRKLYDFKRGVPADGIAYRDVNAIQFMTGKDGAE